MAAKTSDLIKQMNLKKESLQTRTVTWKVIVGDVS